MKKYLVVTPKFTTSASCCYLVDGFGKIGHYKRHKEYIAEICGDNVYTIFDETLQDVKFVTNSYQGKESHQLLEDRFQVLYQYETM